jgi:hypothetical protein
MPEYLRIKADMVISLLFRFLILLVILTHTVLTGLAATYIRPNCDKELFPLEKIPLHVHNMKKISSNLVILTQRKQDDTPLQRRANAQLLALAMQLDPTNKEARMLDQTLSKGVIPKPESPEKILSAKSQIRFYQRWLASPDVGAPANQLALYLADATKTLSPDTINQPDSADWSGVVPSIKHYTPPPKKIETPSSKTAKPADSVTKNKDKTEPSALSYQITPISIKAPLTIEKRESYKNPKYKALQYRTIRHTSITPISLQIRAYTPKKASPKTIMTLPLPWQKVESQRLASAKKITQPITRQLEALHKDLPGSKITVSLEKDTKYAFSNQQTITAPIAIMLEASLLNKPLRQDLVVCASMDESGAFLQPANFWQLIDILRKNNQRGRLIVSPKSAELLAQILVYDEPEFFIRWEVFTAKNLKQAIEIATQGSSDPIIKSSELFQTIQQLTKRTSISKLSVNKAVRQRLNKITTLAPNHLSARILLIQGSRKRPNKLSETTLAHELLPILKHLEKTLGSTEGDNLPPSSELKETLKTLRNELNRFDGLINRIQDDLYDDTLNILNNFRRLITLSRRIEGADYTNRIPLEKKADLLISAMRDDCDTTLKKINLIITPK